MSTEILCRGLFPALVFGLLVPVAAAAQESGAAGLDDARIAHIAVTANAIDADLAELARRRATDARVVRFAETMIADHTAVNEQAGALAARLGLTPVDNDVSRGLQSGADAARARLEGVEASAFDAAYMEREVAYHRAVLEALDGTLIPGTRNGELRALLEGARAAVAGHLRHAEAIRGALAER